RQQVEGHYSVKGHEPAMGSHEDARPLPGNVLEPVRLYPPIMVAKKLEECPSIEPDIVAVHSEIVKTRFALRPPVFGSVLLQERADPRFWRNKPKLRLDPGGGACTGETKILKAFPPPPQLLQCSRNRQAVAVRESGRRMQRDDAIRSHIEYSRLVSFCRATY